MLTRPSLEHDAVHRATATVRGAALAVLAAAARARQHLEQSGGRAEPQVVDEIRGRLRHADSVLGEVERREIEYDGPAPSGAPSSGWEVPAVAAARSWLDEALDAATRASRRRSA